MEIPLLIHTHHTINLLPSLLGHHRVRTTLWSSKKPVRRSQSSKPREGGHFYNSGRLRKAWVSIRFRKPWRNPSHFERWVFSKSALPMSSGWRTSHTQIYANLEAEWTHWPNPWSPPATSTIFSASKLRLCSSACRLLIPDFAKGMDHERPAQANWDQSKKKALKVENMRPSILIDAYRTCQRSQLRRVGSKCGKMQEQEVEREKTNTLGLARDLVVNM